MRYIPYNLHLSNGLLDGVCFQLKSATKKRKIKIWVLSITRLNLDSVLPLQAKYGCQETFTTLLPKPLASSTQTCKEKKKPLCCDMLKTDYVAGK